MADIYYKNDLLNERPITKAGAFGLEFSNGSKIVIRSTSVTANCSNGKITSNGMNKRIEAILDFPGYFSTPKNGTSSAGMIVPSSVLYYTATTTNNPGSLTEKITKANGIYFDNDRTGTNGGILINIEFSSIPTDATKITALFTYLFIFPN